MLEILFLRTLAYNDFLVRLLMILTSLWLIVIVGYCLLYVYPGFYPLPKQHHERQRGSSQLLAL
ncbi:hypothetical protein DL98DRAFT_267736 [Cadophora sp. DSE1049]|nr:hypothetical protein DL98DRAFT_267736 [Cadophora sp. DSE1049]